MMPRRVALDIGTVAPSVALEAATRAVTQDPELEVMVVGPPAGGDPPRGRVSWHAASAADPDRDPAVEVRGRANLSVRVALEMGRDGAVDTVMSASPLSALLTAVRFLLGRRTGVRDPLLAATLHTDVGETVLLDVSGRRGSTPGSLVGAAEDLGPVPQVVGVLEPQTDHRRLAEQLAQATGTAVEPVDTAALLAGGIPLVFADGPAGHLLVDAVSAMAPQRLGPRRVVGLVDAPVVLSLPGEVGGWPQHGFGPREVVA